MAEDRPEEKSQEKTEKVSDGKQESDKRVSTKHKNSHSRPMFCIPPQTLREEMRMW